MNGSAKGSENGPAKRAKEPGRERRVSPRATTPLLELLTQDSMDQGYRVAAERKRLSHDGSVSQTPRRSTTVVTTLAVALFGILVAVAAVQNSRNADVEALGKASLAQRVQSEKAAVSILKTQAGELIDANAAADAELRELRAEEERLIARVSRLGVSAGTLAVRGPGLRITVDDPPDAEGSQVVQDDDLNVLVDGLWASGAEAIAINGQRLTTLSSIQNTGSAIHVNVRPLIPPYVVEAIGDTDRMPARLLASTNGSLFYSVARTLGFVFEVEDDENLELPAIRVRPLLSAVSQEEGRSSEQEELNP